MPKQKSKKAGVEFTDDIPEHMKAEYDEYAKKALEVKPDASAIPDLGVLLQKIKELLVDIESVKMQTLQKNNLTEFESIIMHKYNQDIPIRMIRLMMEEERYDNLEKLMDMFDRLEQVKKGNVNIENAQKIFSEKLNNEYVYPVFGGKEEFEKKMQDEKKCDN